MNRERKAYLRRHVCVLMLVLPVVPVAGCNSFFNSWFDPTQVGSFTRETTLDIRTSLSIQDTPVGIPGATDPRPDDLIAGHEEYRFGPGDVLTIRIFELLARNTETNSQAAVDDIGTISLPVLGQIRVAGMTRSGITQELVALLKERGIIVSGAKVTVEPVIRRGQSFVVFGAIPQPNLYPLPRPDTRLLEAINIAGGFLDSATEVYVIRNETFSSPAMSLSPTMPVVTISDGITMSDGITGAFGGGVPVLASMALGGNASTFEEPTPTTQEAEDQTDSKDRAELIDAVRAPSSFVSETPTSEPAGQPRWIFLNGQWIETTAPPEPQPGAREREQIEVVPAEKAPFERTAPSPVPAQAPVESGGRIDWERLAGDQETRVIRISADALRNGDYRQNIVIRGGDTIRVLAGDVGEYYIMGQVGRPGAYSITGRQITLKTAIASSGNLAPLAWPDRCTIYRRYGDREEMHQVNLDAIFAGKEPDVLLKDNDLILVGTHPAAPFLAVFRNAFRFTYGFGFVWDRNFADVESFGPRINPANLPSGIGSRFPNLFR